MYAYQRGMGALGWSPVAGRPSCSEAVGGSRVCFREAESSWASSRGCRPIYEMGCRQPDGTMSRYPCCNTTAGNPGFQWCCPSGWESGSLPAGSGGSNPTQIRALQQAILAQGCTLPRFGADGDWGSETEAGARCLRERIGGASFARQWPWAAARLGGAAPTLDTGEGGMPWSGKMDTDVQPGAPGSRPAPGAGAGERQVQPSQAGIFPFDLPFPMSEWWFWVALAGVGGLSFVGYRYYQAKKAEEEVEPF